MTEKQTMNKICTSLFCLSVLQLFFSATLSAADNLVNVFVGVQTNHSPEQCLKQWQPLTDYLNQQIPGNNFIIVPLSLSTIEPAVAERKIDFMVSNPAIYVNLEAKHRATRITTMETMILGSHSSQFAGVLFTRKDRKDIRTPTDLKGKKFMAVAATSFGGWHTSWRYLKKQGIDPHSHFRTLRYGGSHDAVVRAVEEGKVDAGSIRAGVLELMAMEGKINLQDFYVLDDKRDTGGSIFMHTTRRYPDWAFAMLADTDRYLAEKVTIALLSMPQDTATSPNSAESFAWTIPLDYQSVHQCLKELHLPPYEDFGHITWDHMVEQYLSLMLIFVAVLIVACLTTAYFLTLNRRLKATAVRLDKELDSNTIMEGHLQQFKQTLDQTLDCVFMFDPETLQYIYANHGAVEQVGYSLGELLKMTALDLKPDFTEEDYRATLEPLIKGEKKSLTFSTTHRTKEGNDLPVEIVQQYVALSDEKSRFVSIVRDISDRLAQESEKEKIQTQLLHAQKLESVGQLAAGIAHEINTPTQFIGTNIDFMDEATQDISVFMEEIQKIAESSTQEVGDKIRTALEEADWEYLAEELPRAISQSQDGVKRVTSIVRAMKEFSHPSSKEKIPQNLNQIINTTVTVARSEWKYVADMEMDLDPDLPPVALLADEMGQVVLNVLVNGAHAIAEKLGDNPEGEKGRISISTRQVDDGVELRIRDSGMGIPEKSRSRIFDPFYTTKEVGKGTGQGLAISHGVITEKHGGKIEFTTETGKGTEFIITLPIDAVGSKITEKEVSH